MKLAFRLFAAALASVVLFNGLSADEAIKSGPQVGEKLAGPFHPLNINGDAAGKTHCLYCQNGENPVAMVFARSADAPTTAKLIKALDKATVSNSKAEMGSFTVFLNDEKGLEDSLRNLVKKEDLKKMVLSIDNPAGPKGYNVSKDADVTVVLYVGRTVKANYSFKKGELKDSDVEKVVSDVSKIVK
jgi:hypothetical protein